MAYVDSTIQATESTSVDVTLAIGTGTNRKIVGFFGGQEVTDAGTLSMTYDPAGDNGSFTVVGAQREVSVDGASVAMVWTCFYYDIPDGQTGTKTIRAAMSGSAGRHIVQATVWDGLATGAAEADEWTSFDDGSRTTAAFTDSITTLSANAVIFQGLVGYAGGSSETWSPDNGQTEREETNYFGFVHSELCDLVKATAGAQTIGSTRTAGFAGGIQILAAFAAASAGGGSTATWQLFPSAKAYLDDGTINIGTHTFKARVLSDSYTADPTDTVLADTTGALGTDQTVTLSVTGGMVSIASATSWTGALANVKHVLLYDDTPTSPADPLLAIVDLGANQSVPTSTTFTLPAGDVYFR